MMENNEGGALPNARSSKSGGAFTTPEDWAIGWLDTKRSAARNARERNAGKVPRQRS